jgi:type I restriction enzyme S subunit
MCLSEFCRIGSGGTPSRSNLTRYYEGGKIPWVKSGELRESVITKTEEHITEAALKETNARIIPAGALLLAMYGATVGRLGFLGVEAATNQAVCHIIPDPKTADTRFLFQALSNQVPNIVARGVGGAQPNISQGIIKDLKLALPPLAEQRRIAEVLDKAEALRTKRRAALAELDSLSQSLFLDLFGDPATNPKGWAMSSLAEVCSIAGQYGSGVPAVEFSQSLPRYVRITDIDSEGNLAPGRVSPGGTSADWSDLKLESGDVLFARSGATVGKTYMYSPGDGDCVFAGYLIRFRTLPTKVLPEVLFHFTRSTAYLCWVIARQRVVAQPNINAKQYGTELNIPLPPLDLQREFARRVAAVEKLKSAQRSSLADLDTLFFSLQQRAFSGNL